VNDILSNEEIDTLLEMFRSSGAVEDELGMPFAAPSTDREDRVSEIDLLKPNRLAREQVRGLERYFESAAKLLSATISEKLRLDARCECVAVEQQRFSTWLEHLPGPAAIYVLEMHPFDQPVLLTASTSMLYGAVDRILGGNGKISRVPRDFTEAEYTVADALMEPCLEKIGESLKDVIQVTSKVTNRFCNPSMAQILPSQDVVLSVYFQVSGEFLIGDLRLLLPFSCLEPYMDKLGKDTVTGLDPGALRDTVQHTLQSVPIDMSVQLGSATITLRQLLTLQEGDVVPLRTRIGEPAIVPVQGRPKFKGHVGQIGNRFAFEIADVMES
jgi:flagellar motor switch protein FliM